MLNSKHSLNPMCYRACCAMTCSYIACRIISLKYFPMAKRRKAKATSYERRQQLTYRSWKHLGLDPVLSERLQEEGSTGASVGVAAVCPLPLLQPRASSKEFAPQS